MAMKKVGGPARNEIRSRATRASACSGRSGGRAPSACRPHPGTSTPLSRPEMWAIGAGMSTASDGPSPWTRAISVAFQLRPRCVCSTALGIARRARGEQDQRDVGGPAGTGAGRRPGAPPDGVGQRGGVGERRRARARATSAGSICAEGRLDVGRAEGVQDRRRHRADAPAGPGQDGGGQAVGHLPGHGVAPSRRPAPAARPATAATSASAWAAESRVSPSTISPPWAASSASRVGTSQGPPGRR